MMRSRLINWLAVITIASNVSGCLLNSVHQIHQRSASGPGQALVIIGVGLEAPWPEAKFSISLDQYSLKERKITGNCFRYNHMEASVSAHQTEVEYSAFIVPAGVYVFSLFNAAAPPGPQPAAFIAPSRGMVYFGNYIRTGDHGIELREDIAGAQIAVENLIPKKSSLIQAEVDPSVQRGTSFLCTP